MYLFHLHPPFDDIGLVVWDSYVIANTEDM